jgi:hypothetical protein
MALLPQHITMNQTADAICRKYRSKKSQLKLSIRNFGIFQFSETTEESQLLSSKRRKCRSLTLSPESRGQSSEERAGVRLSEERNTQKRVVGCVTCVSLQKIIICHFDSLLPSPLDTYSVVSRPVPIVILLSGRPLSTAGPVPAGPDCRAAAQLSTLSELELDHSCLRLNRRLDAS